jgi:adenosylhomocysteine nucleosidase
MMRHRRGRCLYTLIVLTALCVLGCFQRLPVEGFRVIGVMGALDSEIELIKQQMDLADSLVISGRKYYTGEVHGHRIVLVKAGVGKVNAAMSTQLMIDRFRVRTIIFTGIAGGIAPELKVGDIVISDRVIQHDYGLASVDGFHPWSVEVGDSTGAGKPVEYFEPDSQLMRTAMAAAEMLDFPEPESTISPRATSSVRVCLGCIVTGDQFIASEKKRRWLDETFGAYATEMEGGAVAQVCVANGVPFVVVRTLSDLANEDASVDIEKFFAYASRNSAMLVLEMLRTMD